MYLQYSNRNQITNSTQQDRQSPVLTVTLEALAVSPAAACCMLHVSADACCASCISPALLACAGHTTAKLLLLSCQACNHMPNSSVGILSDCLAERMHDASIETGASCWPVCALPAQFSAALGSMRVC